MKFFIVLISVLSISKGIPINNLSTLNNAIEDGYKSRQCIPQGLEECLQKKLEGSPQLAQNGRIYGGQDAPRNAYPFHVGLELSLKSGQKSWCSGSLISDKYVLTAARCLTNVTNATVLLGAYDRLNSSETGRQTQVVLKKNFVLHKSWSEKNGINDIALIKLNKVVNFTKYVQAVALATKEFESIDGRAATITGWGNFNASNNLSQNLQFAQSEIINNTECKKTFGTNIRDTNVCLDGSKGQGTCTGDSGGPLIVVGLFEQLVQVGITSFGSGEGCDKHIPNVFTRISKYTDWIAKNAKIGKQINDQNA